MNTEGVFNNNNNNNDESLNIITVTTILLYINSISLNAYEKWNLKENWNDPDDGVVEIRKNAEGCAGVF